jgi:Xaa-Pro dipeptidase
MTIHAKARKAIRDEHLSGWLFYNYAHRDLLADRCLSVSPLASNTRPWIYLLYAAGPAVKIVHCIESSILDHLPGRREIYGDRTSFKDLLKKYAQKGPEVALNYSPSFPQASFIDHGTVLLLTAMGFKAHPSHNLIPKVLSSLSQAQLRLHERAAGALYRIVAEIWRRVREGFSSKSVLLYEGDVHAWVVELFKAHGLTTDSALIIGTGRHTALPHYMPSGKGARLTAGDLLQIDIWGKLDSEGGIYADISWVGVLSRTVPPAFGRVFDTLVRARDAAVDHIRQCLKNNARVSGAAVDGVADGILRQAGFGGNIKHRTGHSIDTEVHGAGVNIDAGEFPDTRLLCEGSCFSIEPGLYFRDFGMRTEIDVYIHNNNAVISGGTPQTAILTL